MLSDSPTDSVQQLQSKRCLADDIQGATAPAVIHWEAAAWNSGSSGSTATLPLLPRLHAFGFCWDIRARLSNLCVMGSRKQNLKRFPVLFCLVFLKKKVMAVPPLLQ